MATDNTGDNEKILRKLENLKGDDIPPIPEFPKAGEESLDELSTTAVTIPQDEPPATAVAEPDFEVREGVQVIRDEGRSTGYEDIDQRGILEDIAVLLKELGDKIDNMAEGE